MVKTIKGRIFGFALLSALLVSFFIYPSGNVSCTEINVVQNSTSIDNVSPVAVYTKYVTVNTRTSTFPPGQIYHVEWDGDFKYAGYLTRFDYAYDPDAGIYFATYKGNIKIQ